MIMPILIYFLKVNLALAILYIGYRLLFQGDTFFRLRRGTLLSIYLIAFLYQIPDLSKWLSTRTSVTEMVTYYSSILPREAIAPVINEVSIIGWKEIGILALLAVYLIGILLLSLRCLIELFVITRTYLRGRKITINNIRVCLLPQKEEPYSFFGWIFMAPEDCEGEALNEILVHEYTHAKQLHSLDILIGEIVSIVCWINPFVWLLKQEISINHEYIADEHVMLSGYNKKAYQYHLIGMEHPRTAIMQLHNHFSVLPLKKRITMLNKKRTNSIRKVKYLALIPMAAGLLLLNNIDAMARVVSNEVAKPVQAIATAILPAQAETTVDAPIPPEDETIHNICDEMPVFEGGMGKLLPYLANNIKYPEDAIKGKIEGRVSMRFTINKDGSITDVKVIRSVSPSLDKEAIRVVKAMPKWTPGKIKGEAVRVSYVIPVTFRLQ